MFLGATGALLAGLPFAAETIDCWLSEMERKIAIECTGQGSSQPWGTEKPQCFCAMPSSHCLPSSQRVFLPSGLGAGSFGDGHMKGKGVLTPWDQHLEVRQLSCPQLQAPCPLPSN